MDGLFFLLSIVGIVLVMHWVVTNDQVGPDQPTHGLFAMTGDSKQPRRRARFWTPPNAEAPPPERRRDWP
jgi:hypothetical protein